MENVLIFVLGLLLGGFTIYVFTERRQKKELEELKEKYQSEKKALRSGLHDQFARIRTGIVQAVDAYSNAVKLIGDKLPDTGNPQLHLELTVEKSGLARTIEKKVLTSGDQPPPLTIPAIDPLSQA